MIRINTLDRCGETLTIELMGYIHKTEFDRNKKSRRFMHQSP